MQRGVCWGFGERGMPSVGAIRSVQSQLQAANHLVQHALDTVPNRLINATSIASPESVAAASKNIDVAIESAEPLEKAIKSLGGDLAAVHAKTALDHLTQSRSAMHGLAEPIDLLAIEDGVKAGLTDAKSSLNQAIEGVGKLTPSAVSRAGTWARHNSAMQVIGGLAGFFAVVGGVIGAVELSEGPDEPAQAFVSADAMVGEFVAAIDDARPDNKWAIRYRGVGETGAFDKKEAAFDAARKQMSDDPSGGDRLVTSTYPGQWSVVELDERAVDGLSPDDDSTTFFGEDGLSVDNPMSYLLTHDGDVFD